MSSQSSLDVLTFPVSTDVQVGNIAPSPLLVSTAIDHGQICNLAQLVGHRTNRLHYELKQGHHI